MIILEIVFKSNNNIEKINLKHNIILLGENNTYKKTLINNLINELTSKSSKIKIDGANYNSNDFNIIVINEENDFEKEFKFTKTNELRKLIYGDIIDNINSEKLVELTNEIYDKIDNKINNVIDRKINKNLENNLSFQIEIPNINSIIDKFTNIYLDNILLTDKNISKSMKRKLLYELYFYDLKQDTEKNNIIIIENFDAFLSNNEIITILNRINKLSSEKNHFILTSSKNIFEYINLDIFEVYKTLNNIINLNKVKEGIKKYLILKDYKGNIDDFGKFYQDNQDLILDDEINKIYIRLISNYSYNIGKILTSKKLDFKRSKPKIIESDYIICNSRQEAILYKCIAHEFLIDTELV